MSAKNDYQAFLGAEPTQDKPLIVEVPSSLPVLHARHRSGLDRPYRGVGVEADYYEEAPTGMVWQSWFVLGLAIAVITPSGIVMTLLGEWVMLLIAAPFAGLFLVAQVRSLRAEQRAKQALLNKRRRKRRN